MAQKVSQERLMEFRLLETRLESMMRQREMVANRLVEIENTIAGIKEVSKTKGEVIFHVGGEAFLPAKPVEGGKAIVVVGADVALEKNIDEAVVLLESRRKEAENVLKHMQKEIEIMTNELEKMMPEIEAAHGH